MRRGLDKTELASRTQTQPCCENQLLGFLKVYDGAPESVVSYLFEKVPTDTRLGWLRRLLTARNPDPPELRDCLIAFAKAYAACPKNRNILLHLRINAYFAPDDVLMLSKRGVRMIGLRSAML